MTPYVPTLISVLTPLAESFILSDRDMTSFMTNIHEAHRDVGQREAPLEEIFHRIVILLQKQMFWNTMKGFVPFTRAMFRLRLSEALEKNLSTPDGRTIQLGATRLGQSAWEVYSPGEMRLIQVGSLALVM